MTVTDSTAKKVVFCRYIELRKRRSRMDPIVSELVERLRGNPGASAVTMDTEHQYTVEMEGFLLMVHYLEDSEQILLATCVAPLPQGERENIFLALLQGQYFFQRTSGATLAVDNEASFIVLQAVYSLRLLTAGSFIHAVERFMQAAEYWRNECEKLANAGPEETDVQAVMLASGLRV